VLLQIICDQGTP